MMSRLTLIDGVVNAKAKSAERGGALRSTLCAGHLFRCGHPSDELGVFCDRLRAADQKTLDLVARLGRQEGKLALRLDAFRDDRQVEPATKADHRANDCRRLD